MYRKKEEKRIFLAESAHDDEEEYVERDQVDDEHVAAPRRHLSKHTATSIRKVGQKLVYKSVLPIRDILVRIRIRGSVPLTNRSRSGSDSGYRSCYFRQ
jgi:hypothetical protein